MKRTLLAVGVAVLGLSLSGAADATTQTLSRVALHAKATTTKNLCTTWSPVGENLPCADYQYNQIPATAGNTYHMYLVVALFDASAGMGGLSCGVAYPEGPSGIFVGWNLCADLDFPNGNWPANGGGNRITWDVSLNCQRTEVGTADTNLGISGNGHAVAGAFYVYTYGVDALFEITNNENVQPAPEFVVADCSAVESHLNLAQQSSKVGFGSLNGVNGCETVPTLQTTWGSIKKKYKSE